MMAFGSLEVMASAAGELVRGLNHWALTLTSADLGPSEVLDKYFLVSALYDENFSLN